MSDPRQLAERVSMNVPPWKPGYPDEKRDAFNFALDQLVRLADDPFLRYRDKITQTLTYISDKAGSGDYSQVIADMATELLGDLGVE